MSASYRAEKSDMGWACCGCSGGVTRGYERGCQGMLVKTVLEVSGMLVTVRKG
jgi:hypothetical protein